MAGSFAPTRGVNFPGIDLGISAFTDRDRECLQFALNQSVDAVGEPFVQGPEDVRALRRAAAEMGHNPFVIAKIERSRALENIDDILQEVDGIMVARGDLGVEDLISLSVHATVKRLNPIAVITPTETGATARRIARFRLPVWIAGISDNQSTCQRLQFSYGVYPVYRPTVSCRRGGLRPGSACAARFHRGSRHSDQRPSPGNPGGTNRMEIIELGGGKG